MEKSYLPYIASNLLFVPLGIRNFLYIIYKILFVFRITVFLYCYIIDLYKKYYTIYLNKTNTILFVHAAIFIIL